MGNNSSSHLHHASSGASRDMGPGWTHSFPRELHRSHVQPPGHKVLPEPPNQRLRPTNNGNIIHNGGTISGRRLSALTLPHDLTKQAAYRSRSSSGTNFGATRPQDGGDGQYYHYQEGDQIRDRESSEFKRFGSEPDLRYSPMERGRYDRQDGYTERESKEKETRFNNKSKKKYKAPPPPANGDGSSPDSYKWSGDTGDRESKGVEEIRPPPRKSRLFKTRAETKRAQSNWTSLQERESESKRSIDEQSAKENMAWRQQQDRWDKDERRSKMFDGKNTLQRSLSSPEFQAELMLAARKVRSKMNYQREGPVGEAAMPGNEPRSDYPTRGHQELIEERRVEGKSARHEDRFYEERRVDNKNSRNHEISYDHRRDQRESRYQLDSMEERKAERNFHKVLRKSATYDDEVDAHRRMVEKKPRHDRIEKRGHSMDDRLTGDQRPDHSEERRTEMQRIHGRSNKYEEFGEVEKRAKVGARSESPAMRQYREKSEHRGKGSGRESTPEPSKTTDMEMGGNRKTDVYKKHSSTKPEEVDGSSEPRSKEKLSRKGDVRSPTEKNWEILPPVGRSPPKTFYFGMDVASPKESRDLIERQMEQIQSSFLNRDFSSSPESTPGEMDDASGTEKTQSNGDDIALKLRPTLPKKQLEIPRFSPAAAWRLLSALETPYPNMSTASEEGPVLFEERIERLARPPPSLVALGPRSSHDKSGDSGISGDAGAANDDPLDTMTNHAENPLRPAWTPQQDLGEESSSDAGVDSPPPTATPVKFPQRPHVFSLSLPRDDNRLSLYNPEYKNKETPSFNSLQKLKRSVSGALRLGVGDLDRKKESEMLDDNWLLSTSAPNSLQHNHTNGEGASTPSPGWETNFAENEEDNPEFPMIMKPPSFSYLASGGHVMYLPDCNGGEFRSHSLNYRTNNSEGKNSTNSSSRYKKNLIESKKMFRYSSVDTDKYSKESTESARFGERRGLSDLRPRSRKYSNFSKSCENISEMKQRERSPSPGPEDLQDAKQNLSDIKEEPKRNAKGKRFTFQSTVRQIERRRLAEKLSREAEAKERQRKGELEAMRKVEEEFQKKRAREKASIRQQLRLINMDENQSLPVTWDNAKLSRAEPDGAPSSAASSPTSAPASKLMATRKISASSDEYHRKHNANSEYRQPQQHREYKDYRSRYYEFGPESAPHIEYKQTTVHPKVVYDIPKSAPLYVDAKLHPNKASNPNLTPRSDNYRKDFAHGAVAARSSMASSDSELSQPNTRPQSRQTGNKIRAHRSRSASPARSQDASSEEESPVEPITRERIPANNLMLNAIQPFVREKSYRPIPYNLQPSPLIPS